MLIAVFKNKFIELFISNFGTFSFRMSVKILSTVQEVVQIPVCELLKKAMGVNGVLPSGAGRADSKSGGLGCTLRSPDSLFC